MQQQNLTARFKSISDTLLDFVHVLPEEELRADIVYKFTGAGECILLFMCTSSLPTTLFKKYSYCVDT